MPLTNLTYDHWLDGPNLDHGYAGHLSLLAVLPY